MRLCRVVLETHHHLFFECRFTTQIWKYLKDYAKLDRVPCYWEDFIDFMKSRSNKNAIWSIIRRLLLGAVVFYTWGERNRRLHKNISWSPKLISQDIMEEIRLKLLSLNARNSVQVKEAGKIWLIKSWQA